MTDIDIGARLRADDPLIDDPSMSAADVETMRRRVIDAAVRSAQSPAWWPPLLAVLATAAALFIAVVGARGARVRTAPPQASRLADAPSIAPQSGTANDGRRQLQFATPGGTRVIWVFDPEFNP